MSKDPWTDPDPQSGDFDVDLATLDPSFAELHDGSPDAKLRMVVTVEEDDAKQLEQIARARGEEPGQVVAALIRDAAHGAA